MRIKQFFSLIRWPNLVIITLSMVFIRWFLILPGLGVSRGMNMAEFIVLVASVLFITIGGYIINDYFDMDADRINKPGKNLVGTTFSVALATNLYYLFSALGVIGGLLISWWVYEINYGLIFLFTAGMLWFYSERYQCQPVLGNLVVAFLSALSFGLVWLFDFFALKNNAELFSTAQSNFAFVNRLVLIYMGFAFLSSLFREMVKDMEDIEGDKRMGCRTLPVTVGMDKAKLYTTIAGAIMLLFMIWVQYFLYASAFYFAAGFFVIIGLLLIVILYKLRKAGDPDDFSNLSGLSKLLILLGILSMIMFYFEG